MSNDLLRPKPSLVQSSGRLWNQSPLWKSALLGAVIFSGLILLDPPWEWGESKFLPVQQTTGVDKTITAITPAVQQSEKTTLAVQPSQVAQANPEQPQPHTSNQPIPESLTSQIVEADQNCGSGGPMRISLSPPPAIEGEIKGFLSDAEASALIPRSEQMANGRIDPAYIHNLRAVLHPLGSPANVSVTVLVPHGMNVHIGEMVMMVGGHASPRLACTYVPNLITGDVSN